MKKIIVANWKMNPQSLEEAKKLFRKINFSFKKLEVVLCPPFPFLLAFKKAKIKLGAQNCFFEEKGAFTGEVSPLMLKNLGTNYVILGHSERREMGESDELINRKIKTVLKNKLKVILCIGEKEIERKEKKTFFVLKKQLEKDLKNIPFSQLPSILIAYEPVWAIGTKNPCPPEMAKEVLLFLKKIFPKNKILYGGSVNLENAKEYIKVGFDGLLVGSFSLKKEFSLLLKSIENLN